MLQSSIDFPLETTNPFEQVLDREPTLYSQDPTIAKLTAFDNSNDSNKPKPKSKHLQPQPHFNPKFNQHHKSSMSSDEENITHMI